MKLYQLTTIVSLFLLCFFLEGQAQSLHIMNAYRHYKFKAATNYHDLLFLVRNSLDKKVEGDAYLMDWEGALLFVDDDEVYSVSARYRVLDDEFQIDLNGQTKAIYAHLVKGIVFKDRIFVSGTELRSDGQLNGFYELLVNGDRQLLKKYTVTQKVRKDGVTEIGKKTVSYHFRSQTSFVEAIADYHQQPHVIFEDHQKVAKLYWKSNHLNIKKEADLRQYFEYFNR
ncbi:MAG: hypothetical protein AAGI23_03895 [Bacteroidota bacterium]